MSSPPEAWRLNMYTPTGCGQRGLGDGVGNIMKLKVKKDLFSLLVDFLHHLGPLI